MFCTYGIVWNCMTRSFSYMGNVWSGVSVIPGNLKSRVLNQDAPRCADLTTERRIFESLKTRPNCVFSELYVNSLTRTLFLSFFCSFFFYRSDKNLSLDKDLSLDSRNLQTPNPQCTVWTRNVLPMLPVPLK